MAGTSPIPPPNNPCVYQIVSRTKEKKVIVYIGIVQLYQLIQVEAARLDVRFEFCSTFYSGKMLDNNGKVCFEAEYDTLKFPGVEIKCSNSHAIASANYA